MKKICMLLMVAMCATMFTACSDDDDKNPLNENIGEEGVITMIQAPREFATTYEIYTFNKGDKVYIDWGDGTVEEYTGKKEVAHDGEFTTEGEIMYKCEVKHIHTGRGPYTISLKGNIKGLICRYSSLTSLDVSKNTALTILYCGHNNLTSLNISMNTALTHLNCVTNSITSLDLSKCIALKKLNCAGNNITSLDVSNSNNLRVLDCGDNEVTILNLNNCISLVSLDCECNNLTSLDISKNTALTYLYCLGNNLITLDVSKNTVLTRLNCERNNLTSLDVSKNTALTYLYCLGNNFSVSAMNAIYKALPTVNYGVLSCDEIGDYSIAENKGWVVR